jgi:hypothetical protein
MKHLSVSLILSFIVSTISLMAQDFEPTLAATLKQFENDTSLSMMMATVNRLELIAGKWSDQWLAQYYAAYGDAVCSYIEKDEVRRDGLLDKADQYLARAEQLYGQESDELYALRAMIANARLAVKPGDRWKKYGDIFNENIAKAKSLNPTNPRIYYLQGNSVLYTPVMFGGGAKRALPYFEEADSLYRQVPADSLEIMPSWGEEQNMQMLDKCKDTVRGKE